MNILLTGGTGFIGSYITVELLRLGHAVTILARDKNKVPGFKDLERLEIVEGTIVDKKLLSTLVVGKDACIHAALNYTKNTGWEVLLDDTLPTVFLADAAAEAGVKHFIYTSSTAVNDLLYNGARRKHDDAIDYVTVRAKHCPSTLYGATKAACENYLIAQSYRFPMRVNIIRPGYTFGNPVVAGAAMQADGRFDAIVKAATADEPILIVKNDGTQFIWAGDLAKVYAKLLDCNVNGKTYFALSRNFVPWQAIAQEAVLRCDSKSRVTIEDKGWRENGLLWDVSDMKKDFGLEFDSWEKIREHIDYCIEQTKQAGGN
jgi:UDP-glucose 4-epimerase